MKISTHLLLAALLLLLATPYRKYHTHFKMRVKAHKSHSRKARLHADKKDKQDLTKLLEVAQTQDKPLPDNKQKEPNAVVIVKSDEQGNQNQQVVYSFKAKQTPLDKKEPISDKKTKDGKVDEKEDSLRKAMEKQSAVMAEEAKKKQKPLVVDPVPYESKFVNGSRPLPKRNTPIPDQWEDASLVKQISTYSKKFLRDINDPKVQKSRQMLVGKPVYIENDIVFDQAPEIVQESAPLMTGVSVVQRDYNTQEKADLWRKFNNEEFKDGFKDVQFSGNLADFSPISDVLQGAKVKVRLAQRNAKPLSQVLSEQKDRILEDTVNPVKRVVFTKDRIKDITFDDHSGPKEETKRLLSLNQMAAQGYNRKVDQKGDQSYQRGEQKSISQQALYNYEPTYYSLRKNRHR